MGELLFGKDVRPSAQMAVALINTSPARSGTERLASAEVLRVLGRDLGVYYRPGGSEAELHAVRRLRDRLDEIVESSTLDQRMAMLNELFYSASAIPQLVVHPEDPEPHFHYTLEDAGYVDHLKGLTAYALSRLTIMGEFARIRSCDGDACRLLFFDVTRNGKRLYCDSRTCGNRTHAARYRARRRQADN